MAKKIEIEDLPIIDVNSKAYQLRIPFQDIPEYITSNLKYTFFKWQKDAFENFLTYQAIKHIESPNSPTHLMFNMATGTGKTMLMAAAILYYYNQGYSHFLFFVNQNNIVDKTENNFINSTHSKYLFTEKIIIDNQTIDIKQVNTFSDSPQGIEIKFTSIQKLYNDIHIQKENQTTLTDLQSKNIVMLADEAHHFNASTKSKQTQAELHTEFTNRTSDSDIERLGWEHTILQLILNKNGQTDDNKNVLLEFTATIPDSQQVVEKYKDKIIFKFGLKEFLKAGYTKEINLISSSLGKKERILQALLFQWYRYKIALKYNVPNFKPVVLFRSKTIEESKQDYSDFLLLADTVSASDFDFIKSIENSLSNSKTPYEQGKSRTERVLQFIKDEKINTGEIALWIKNNFKENLNVIITNSETNTSKKEKTDDETERLLNSLEDKDNHVRAIFTVNRLTEGWDVLNLYDIVRLYEGRDEGKDGEGGRKAGSSTISEKQLIGRGVRYFPFAYNDKIKNKRKFDNDEQHELRILEELFFYSTNEERYIDELKRELKKEGFIIDERVLKTFALKKEFLDKNRSHIVWYNQVIDNPDRQKKDLESIKKDFKFKYTIKGLEISETDKILSDDSESLKVQQKTIKTEIKKIKELEKHIFDKAINIKAKQEGSLLRFDNLQKELDIKSIDELQANQLANFEINFEFDSSLNYEDIPNSEKLNAVIQFLDKVFTEFKGYLAPKIGTDFIAGDIQQFFSEPKTKSINTANLDDSISKDNEWYIIDGFVGTSEEKSMIQFIKNTMGNLEQKYDNIYLLRNEEVLKIYDFKQGRGFQPDFILFLKSKEKNSLYYQIFIEPKGNQFIDAKGSFTDGTEGWKEIFLNEITEKYGFENVIKAENPNYRLIGLPFYNDSHNSNFKQQYNKIIN